MGTLILRPMSTADASVVEQLLDSAIGEGFWDPATDLDGIARVAVLEDRVVGVGTASLDPEPSDDPLAQAAVGHVRLVAVAPLARGRGVATLLVSELVAECEALGAASTVAYAWVHGPAGVAPLAGALARNGFVRQRRIADFYAGANTAICPACATTPCMCPADLYVRTTPDRKDDRDPH